jgi:hypothetical protein
MSEEIPISNWILLDACIKAKNLQNELYSCLKLLENNDNERKELKDKMYDETNEEIKIDFKFEILKTEEKHNSLFKKYWELEKNYDYLIKLIKKLKY